MTNTTVLSEEPRSGDVLAGANPALLQVHLAEYNTLTTRLTSQLTLQFAVWPIVMGLWGVLALVWDLGKVPEFFLLWGGAALSQAFGLMWYQSTVEIYQMARYLEQDLKPLVAAAIGDKSTFWLWEQRVNTERGNVPLIWEWPVAVVGWGMVGWIAFHQYPWGFRDYLALIINSILALLMAAAAWKAGKTRREIAPTLKP